MMFLKTICLYSKGFRVFSSSLTERRIFTASSISLSQYWRQCRSSYAIHAGQNLLVKEFRYLRTVRVTAAVYPRFKSILSYLMFPVRHRAGLRPNSSFYKFAESCVFNKQSLLPLSCFRGFLQPRSFLFQSYKVNLQSSFSIVHSIALVFSTYSPVSVYSTVLY